jgi:hypothetical protein
MPILSRARPERLLLASYRIDGPRGAPTSPLPATTIAPPAFESPILLEDCHVRTPETMIPGRLLDGRLEGTYRVVNEITACDSGPIPFSPV